MDGTVPGHVAAALVDVAAVVLRHMPERQGMSLTMLSTLGRLDRLGPTRLTVLAAAEGVAQPSMTQLIQRLEQHGLVERVRDPADGRAWLVEITDAGRLAMGERRAARDAWLTGLVAELSEEEQEALGSALRVAAPILRKMVRGTESLPAPRTSAPPVREADRGNKGIPDGYRRIDTAGR